MSEAVMLILSETPLRRFRPFGVKNQPRAGIAYVVATDGGDIQAVAGKRTLGELAFAPHATQYEVDVAHHHSRLEFPLKSADDGYDFTAVVEATWQVVDPARVVRQRITDGVAAVTRHVRMRMLSYSRRFDVERYRDLEQAISAEFHDADVRLLDQCLFLHSFGAEIGLDEAGREWFRNRGATRREGELIKEVHSIHLLKQKHAQDLEAQGRKHELELAELQAKFEHEVKQREHQMEMAQRWHEEQQKIALERTRAEAITEAMERGDAAVLAAHIGRHPDDTGQIVKMIIEHKSATDERRWALVSEMIGKGLIIGADLEEYRNEVVHGLRNLLTSSPQSVFALAKILDMSVGELTQGDTSQNTSSHPSSESRHVGGSDD